LTVPLKRCVVAVTELALPVTATGADEVVRMASAPRPVPPLLVSTRR
jgi:hypothetical protein